MVILGRKVTYPSHFMYFQHLKREILYSLCWESKTHSHRYIQSCCNTCFENTSFFQGDWSNQEQSEHQLLFAHAQFLMQKNGRWTQKTVPHRWEPSRNIQPLTCTHVRHLPATLVHSVRSHTHPHPVVEVSVRLQVTLLLPIHRNSQTTVLPTSISTSQLQVLFKVKWHT